MAMELARDREEFENDTVIVKDDGDSWSIRKLNYHTITEWDTKEQAVAEANRISRYVEVEK